MKKFKTKPKVMLLAMAVWLLSPISVFAQEGLFQRGVADEEYYGYGGTIGLMGRSESTTGGYFTGQSFGTTGANITGQTFGAPLGSGLFVLLVAGVGYATIKSRKKQNKQNRKEK